MAKIVSATYGQALFELAVSNNSLKETATEVEAIKSAFLANDDLIKLLSHPKISTEEKVQVLENVFKNKVSDVVLGLIITMVQKGRCSEIIETLDYFLKESDEFMRIGTAYVTSAVELSSVQKDSIERKLIETTKYNKFKMNYVVDKGIIGGLVIKIGDRVVDSSVKTKLDRMSNELFEVQL